MQDWITELMNLYEQDQPNPATGGLNPSKEVQELRISLVQEELGETLKAMKERDMVETADGLADTLVVVLGTHNAYGLLSKYDYRGQMPANPPRFLSDKEMEDLINRGRAYLDLIKIAVEEQYVPGVKNTCDDIVYYALDAAMLLGIDILPVFMEVHWSNKTKFGEDGKPIKREDGKVIKGPNYQKPDIAGVLKRQEKYYIHTKG
jgi:predicted HAD superfamily Cof-like phosphohydrolase